MDNLTFGLTMAIVGMGGTLVTLGLMALLIHLLTVFLPPGDGKGDS